MGQYQVVVANSAVKDLEHIYQHYIDVAEPAVADSLMDCLEEAVTSLEQNPQRGHTPREFRQLGNHYLEVLIPPFRLIYRIIDQQVIIIMVLHQKQSVAKALRNRDLRR